jgi:hypothetical protein
MTNRTRMRTTTRQLTTINGTARTCTESVRAGDFTIRKAGAIPITPMPPSVVHYEYSVIYLSDGSQDRPRENSVLAESERPAAIGGCLLERM